MRYRDRLVAALAASALLAPWVVHADEKKPDADRSPVGCVNINRIEKTNVIDDRTIVFFMRGSEGQIYVNHLPSACRNLEAEDRFSYNVNGGRLCKIDRITVLPRNLANPTLCKIGEFTPISAEEVTELRAIHDRGKSPKDNPASTGSDAPHEEAEPAR